AAGKTPTALPTHLVGRSTPRVGRRNAASVHTANGGRKKRRPPYRSIISCRAVNATRWPPKRGRGACRIGRPKIAIRPAVVAPAGNLHRPRYALRSSIPPRRAHEAEHSPAGPAAGQR